MRRDYAVAMSAQLKVPVGFYGVKTTKIYCRPGCPSRAPKPENIRPFETCEDAERAGFRACKRCRPNQPLTAPAEAITRVCRYLDEYYDANPTLETLAKVGKLSPFHLLRTFKEATGMTPKSYAQLCRVTALKKNLKKSRSVTDAIYEAGYGSSSRLYEHSNQQLGMTPRAYRNGGLGVKIRYTVVGSPLGRMLVAATDKGICALYFGKASDELERELKLEFPFAEREHDARPMLDWLEELNHRLEGSKPRIDLPLDLQGTVFQRRVWSLLKKIPSDQTRTYSDIAKQLGEPKSARAVARACATNSVAVIVPCHRVLRNDGSLGGYRWGLSRKVQLIGKERESAS